MSIRNNKQRVESPNGPSSAPLLGCIYPSSENVLFLSDGKNSIELSKRNIKELIPLLSHWVKVGKFRRPVEGSRRYV